ncbi:Glu-tRNA(Gln) amidotransferase GatDE subunit E [Candidatus Woesearchaeota archaeon]|nr:Glu-tRNA(Gln) amidotransferase GatDE subunit E [Candidatus Woesearchaeota archaeon]
MADYYAALGFKCGIEIHQQLEGKKLFCACPTRIRKDDPDFVFVRELRASAGESGKVDKAARHEQSKEKSFVYYGYYDTTCSVEFDDEPPHEIDQEALQACLQICKALHCDVVDQIQVMRKTVVDGSNVSGFQRTALVGRDGFVEVDGKKIGIESVCLEEEACQILKRSDTEDIYNLSRLGIPLLEIATEPSIRSPEECKAVAEKLGSVLRSIPQCKRGIGTIRQDVNVSIKGGTRVEIKGFQDLKSIPKVVAFEVERHRKEIKKGKMEPHVRKAEADGTTSYQRPMPGAARMYPETDVEVITPRLIDVKKLDLLEDRVDRLVKLGISKDLAKKVVSKGFDVEGYVKKYPTVKPLTIAETLFSVPKEVRKKTGKEIVIAEVADLLFSAVQKGKMPVGAISDALVEYAKSGKLDLSRFSMADMKEVEEEIKRILKKEGDAPIGAIMGKIMAIYRGKVDGQEVMKRIKKHYKGRR